MCACVYVCVLCVRVITTIYVCLVSCDMSDVCMILKFIVFILMCTFKNELTFMLEQVLWVFSLNVMNNIAL